MKIDGIIWLRDVVDKLALIYKRTKGNINIECQRDGKKGEATI